MWLAYKSSGRATKRSGLAALAAQFCTQSAPDFIGKCRQSASCQGGTYTSDWSEGQWRNYLSAYYRFTEQADTQVGRLLQALRTSGLDQDTLVLFTSDTTTQSEYLQLLRPLILWIYLSALNPSDQQLESPGRCWRVKLMHTLKPCLKMHPGNDPYGTSINSPFVPTGRAHGEIGMAIPVVIAGGGEPAF